MHRLQLFWSRVLHGSKTKRVLFDHLPKAGGSTLNRYLGSHYAKRKIFTTDGLKPHVSIEQFTRLPESARYRFRLIRGHLTHELIEHCHPESLKVTVFREPIDRIVSHYYYAKKTPKHYLYTKLNESSMTLSEYVSSDLSNELTNWHTLHFSGLPQEEIDKNPDAAVEKAEKFILERYDLVGFLDDFPAFVEKLRAVAHLHHEYKDHRVNATADRPSQDRLPSDTIETISNYNALDIELFSRLRQSMG